MNNDDSQSAQSNKSLMQLYAEHTGKMSDKWSSYLIEYDRILAEYRHKPVRLLEIGIQNGGSLEIWSKYFPNAMKMVGCDINDKCAELEFEDPRISLVIGDANSVVAQEAIAGQASSFDIIIDDGSHRSSDVLKSFARYFPLLVDGGIYVVEDLHCSYWREYEGGLYDPFSSLTFFKRLADIVNHEHWGIEKPASQVFYGVFSKYGFHMDEGILRTIHSVQFLNSLCVVRKESSDRNRLSTRVVAGDVETVTAGIAKLHGSAGARHDQTRNEWTTRDMPSEEELHLRLAQLAQLENEAVALKSRMKEIERAIAQRDAHIEGLHQTIAARDRRITSLTAALTGHEAQLVTIRARVQELEHSLASTRADLKAKKEELEQRTADSKRLRRKVTKLEAQLLAIYDSPSWRVTGPFRALSRALRLGRILRNMRRVLKLGRWLATGQFSRAAKGLLPYYRRFVPDRIREIVPQRLRSRIKQRLLPRPSAPASPPSEVVQEKAIAQAKAASQAKDWSKALDSWLVAMDLATPEAIDMFDEPISTAVLGLVNNEEYDRAIGIIHGLKKRRGERKVFLQVEGIAYLRMGRFEEAKALWTHYWQRALNDTAFVNDARLALRSPGDNDKFPVTSFCSETQKYGELGARICVYTALFGDYDELRSPLYRPPGVDFICFSDQPRNVSGWEIRIVDLDVKDPILQNRKIKILPYEFLPAYDCSFYIDSNIIFLSDPLLMYYHWLKDKPFVAWPHPERCDIYDECEAILAYLRHEPLPIIAQYEYFKEQQVPRQTGLIQAGFMWRDHRNEDVRCLMEKWWSLVSRFGGRDQPALAYCMWLTGIRPEVIPNYLGTSRQKEFLHHFPHQIGVLELKGSKTG